MATASRRITRKQLRQPDWFQVGSDHALEYFTGHKAVVFAAAAGIVLLVAALWAWQSFKENQNVMASREFTRALSLYQNQKYSDAIAAFEKVQTFRCLAIQCWRIFTWPIVIWRRINLTRR